MRTGKIIPATATETTRIMPGAGITGTATAVPGITVTTATMKMATGIPATTGMETEAAFPEMTSIPETMEILATAEMERGMVIQEIPGMVRETPEISAMEMATIIPAIMVTATTGKTARAKAQTTQVTATPPMPRNITARTRAASCSR